MRHPFWVKQYTVRQDETFIDDHWETRNAPRKITKKRCKEPRTIQLQWL